MGLNCELANQQGQSHLGVLLAEIKQYITDGDCQLRHFHFPLLFYYYYLICSSSVGVAAVPAPLPFPFFLASSPLVPVPVLLSCPALHILYLLLFLCLRRLSHTHPSSSLPWPFFVAVRSLRSTLPASVLQARIINSNISSNINNHPHRPILPSTHFAYILLPSPAAS